MKYNILFIGLLLIITKTNKNVVGERIRAKNRRNYYKKVEEKRILDNMDKMQLIKYYEYDYNYTLKNNSNILDLNNNNTNSVKEPLDYWIYFSVNDMFNLAVVVLCSLFTD